MLVNKGIDINKDGIVDKAFSYSRMKGNERSVEPHEDTLSRTMTNAPANSDGRNHDDGEWINQRSNSCCI